MPRARVVLARRGARDASAPRDRIPVRAHDAGRRHGVVAAGAGLPYGPRVVRPTNASPLVPGFVLIVAVACSGPGVETRGLVGTEARLPGKADRAVAETGSSGANERRMIDGEWWEVVGATAEAATYDDARNRAIAAARAALLALQRQRIRQDVRDFVREEAAGENGATRSRYREEFESVLVARTEGELQRCRVLEASARPGADGVYLGTAVVACPERVLFPTRRLQTLVQRMDATPAMLLELAAEYETEGQAGLAEQALRWAYDRGGGAEAALALAKHFGRRALYADALRWCDVAARDAPGTPIGAEAASRGEELRRRIETSEQLVAQLLQVAESKQDRTRFAASVFDRRPAPGGVEWEVRWELRGELDRRVLKMWLDDTLTPAWWAEDETDEPRPSARDGGVRFTLPDDAPPAKILFWSLPLDSELWPRLVAWKNVEIDLDRADEQQRLQLRDLVVGLRNSSAVAAVVPVERGAR